MKMTDGNNSDVIFLLGAGATVDAGLPTVKELTRCILDRLPELSDISGTRTTAFKEIFKYISRIDPCVDDNYEKFFDYIHLITETAGKSLFNIDMPKYLCEKTFELPYLIGDLVKDILEEYQQSATPDYLSHLKDYIPESGRIKVFTSNYDTCIEYACKSEKIPFTTGFEEEWNPSLFDTKERGINLYKIHGSLNWYSFNGRIEERTERPNKKRPELILGPGSKIQPDDPFITLFHEFHKAVREARICVVIGFSYQDEHIKKVFDNASRNGLKIIDVNVNRQALGWFGENEDNNVVHIEGQTKKIFEESKIVDELRRLRGK